MRHTSKKLLVLLIAMLVVFGMLAATAFAEGEGESAAASQTTCTYCDGTGTLSSGDECEDCGGTGIIESDSRMAFKFWALVPPIVAIVLALITKEVYSSLFVGILLGALFYSNFGPVGALNAVINDGLVSAVADNAGIFIFLVILGIMVALINRAGGSAAFGRWAEKNIKSRGGAMIATFILGVVIFIDDYFNCLTVGSVMRPITDKQKISRAKLAYLIDATAAPICMIAPISSWAAAVSGVVEGDQGIALFVRAIPWNFYSLLSVVFIIALVIMKMDYGPMRLHEMNAMLNGDLYTTGDRVDQEISNVPPSPRGRVIDLVLPVVVLIVTCFIGLLYVGGYWDASDPDYYHHFIAAFGNTDAFVALPWGSLIALIFTLIYFWLRRVVNFKDSMKCIPQGFIAMVPAITILTFATALKNMTGLLGAKFFIGNLMNGAAAGLFSFLPAIIFLVACLLSFSTGTSWGTFGILIPIVTFMFDPSSTLFYVGVAACLAGAVFGDHCSPISDTTIMASAGAQSNHVNHVSTQLPYAATVGAVCFVNYIIAGLVKNAPVCILIGAVLTIAVLIVIKKTQKPLKND